MKDQNYTTSFTVDQTSEEVFTAIIDPQKWWEGDNEGNPDKLGAEFTHKFNDEHRCNLQVTELITGKKVVWHVLENYFKFTNDKTEWTGTDIIFEISKRGDKTEVHFTHIGLVPAYECFDVCSTAWGSLINGNLKNLITQDKPHQSSSD